MKTRSARMRFSRSRDDASKRLIVLRNDNTEIIFETVTDFGPMTTLNRFWPERLLPIENSIGGTDTMALTIKITAVVVACAVIGFMAGSYMALAGGLIP